MKMSPTTKWHWTTWKSQKVYKPKEEPVNYRIKIFDETEDGYLTRVGMLTDDVDENILYEYYPTLDEAVNEVLYALIDETERIKAELESESITLKDLNGFIEKCF